MHVLCILIDEYLLFLMIIIYFSETTLETLENRNPSKDKTFV